MIHLKEYILESRMRVGSLPFTREEFKKYCPEAWDSDNKFVKEIDKRIESKYNKQVLRSFRGWVEGTWYDSNLDVLYDILLNIPIDRLDKMLGAGSNGSAIDFDGKVIKLFHKNTPMNKDDRRFYEYCLEHPCKVFPKIYKLGKNFVVMEKLKTDTPKCKRYDDWLGWNPKHFVDVSIPENDTQDGKATIEECVRFYAANKNAIDKAIKKLPALGKEVFNWALEAFERIQNVIKTDNFMDLRLANIGERDNGDIVWFDI